MREVAALIVFVGIIVLFAFLVNKGCERFKDNYVAPDTTVVYKNGHWDTVITKKSLPAWLK